MANDGLYAYGTQPLVIAVQVYTVAQSPVTS